MVTVQYFWHGFIHRGTTFMYLQYSHPLIYHLLPNVWKASYTISTSTFVDVPHWTPYSMDKFISCVVPGSSLWFFHFGEEIVIVWTQQKTTTLGGTEPYHSSWQCKESHRCCHGPLAPLEMGDSGTSTVLSRYESMWLRSLCQSCCCCWTTAMYYSYGQRPSPSVDWWYVVLMMYDGHMITGAESSPNFLTFVTQTPPGWVINKY